MDQRFPLHILRPESNHFSQGPPNIKHQRYIAMPRALKIQLQNLNKGHFWPIMEKSLGYCTLALTSFASWMPQVAAIAQQYCIQSKENSMKEKKACAQVNFCQTHNGKTLHLLYRIYVAYSTISLFYLALSFILLKFQLPLGVSIMKGTSNGNSYIKIIIIHL